MVGRVDKIDAADRRRALEGQGHRPFVDPLRAHAALARGAPQDAGAGSRARPGARSRADRARPRRRSNRKTPVTGSFAIRNVHRTVGAMLGGEIARRYGSAGLPDGTIHFKFNGSAGPELRRVRSQRRHARTRRRHQRLPRQGPFRRPHHRLSAEDFELPAGRKHPGRQRRSLRRNQRRSLPERHRRRALRRAQLRRHRGGRRRGRPRLRVHDQRHASS